MHPCSWPLVFQCKVLPLIHTKASAGNVSEPRKIAGPIHRYALILQLLLFNGQSDQARGCNKRTDTSPWQPTTSVHPQVAATCPDTGLQILVPVNLLQFLTPRRCRLSGTDGLLPPEIEASLSYWRYGRTIRWDQGSEGVCTKSVAITPESHGLSPHSPKNWWLAASDHWIFLLEMLSGQSTYLSNKWLRSSMRPDLGKPRTLGLRAYMQGRQRNTPRLPRSIH